MNQNELSRAEAIDALTLAAEFMMTAVRSLGHGHAIEDEEVRGPLTWAAGKLEEVGINFLQ